MARRRCQPRQQSGRASTRLAIRLIPIFILCVFVLATYMFVGRICVQYYIYRKQCIGFAAAIMAIYFVLFGLTVAAYVRTMVTVVRDPGLVPLLDPRQDEDASADEKVSRRRRRPSPKRRQCWSRQREKQQQQQGAQDLETAQQQQGAQDLEAAPHQPRTWGHHPVDMNPDSPGLERFYSKDVFVCEADGRPRWCSVCRQWKPDRAHHSSEMGRCVRKMDHLCPWVGGMVAETSFNFFTQFTFYCALYCSLVLAVSAYTVSRQVRDRDAPSSASSPDSWAVAITVLSALFLLFSGGMTLAGLRYILTNMTNIDMYSRNRISYLAVLIPLDSPPSSDYSTIVYPLQQPVLVPPPTTRVSVDAEHGPPPSAADTNTRDGRARRRFAIVRLEKRENPWDLGLRGNWTSVMGHGPLEWLLPIRHSPCCRHDGMESDYPTGKLLGEVKRRYGLDGV